MIILLSSAVRYRGHTLNEMPELGFEPRQSDSFGARSLAGSTGMD